MSTCCDNTLMEKQAEEQLQAERAQSRRVYRPNVDIVEGRDELTLYADMPGASPDGIEINFENGVLTLHGRVDERISGETKYLWREYGVGDFHRTFQLSDEIDASQISAEFRHGVLVLHLPKVEHAKPRKIEVKVGG